MAAHQAFYRSAVKSFAQRHFEQITHIFGLKSHEVTTGDLVLLLESTVGKQMRICFEHKGRCDESVVKELVLTPSSRRSLEFAAGKIGHAEIGMAMNKPIHKALSEEPVYGAALNRLMLEWRRNRMRREMKALAATAHEVEILTVRLLSAIDNFRDNPNFETRIRVKMSITAVNKSLLRAHGRARMASVWALRSGYSSASVTKAIHGLYIKRMRRLSSGMAKLDQWIGKNGYQSALAPGIQRRTKILSRELLSSSANPELLSSQVRYPKESRQRQAEDLSYG